MLAACTMEGMIDRMVGDEDQAFVQQFVSDMREGDMAALEAVIDPDIWKDSAGEFDQAAASFPEGEGETRIISYSMNSTSLGDNAPTNKEFTVVTTDDSYWTVTHINTYQRGSTPTVTGWSVEGMDEPPAELEALETVGTVMTALAVGLLVFIAIVIWLIIFLVRRSNRKSRERRNAGIS